MPAPDPTELYPAVYGPNFGRAQGWPVVFLKPLVQSPFIEVGDYSYYADPVDPTGFERNNVLFHYGPDKLIIGKYCALAREVRFIMGAAGHRMGLSTFPFPMFGDDWMDGMDLFAERVDRPDTELGHDVWLGYGVTVMAGVNIGHGAIVAARSVVSSSVPPYAIVAGNPARLVRMRFSDEQIERLLAIAWWDWPVELVGEQLRTIMGNDLDGLERIADANGLIQPRVAVPSQVAASEKSLAG